MIPILFAPKSREYNNNGLGVLVDVGYCTVTEERNGAFELELQYPVNGVHYPDLAVDCQILAKPNETSDPQAFRIYNISKPMNGVVTVSAEHISYELSSVIVSPFSATSAVDALSKIKENSITENKFDFWTDKDTVANMSQTLPLSARALLGGVEGSILDVYTGEYEFDNYTVKLRRNRGANNGVTISYAKNLTGIKCEERSDGIVTGAIAYWTKETDGVVQTVYGDLQTIDTELSYSRNVLVDCSSEFEEAPSKASLNEYATKYIQSHKNVPYFSVSVEFVNLGDTEEYKQYKGLYRVSLCDTVTVRHQLYGIDVKAKVVKTVFDSVREKYEKIEIGEVSANISQTIAAQEKEIAQKVGFSDLDKAVENATSAIAGNKGGYVVLHPNAINPQELLILDKPKIEEAVDVWRWNLAGLGHSSSGYNGKYSLAILASGAINADFITTGTLDASIIKAGVLTSKNGLSSFSLDTGEAQFGGSSYYTKISSGSIKQYLSTAKSVVGGIVPIGAGDEFSQSFYYVDQGKIKDVSIAYQNPSSESPLSESFVKIATFKKTGVSIENHENSAFPLSLRRYVAARGTSIVSLGSVSLSGQSSIALKQQNEGSEDYVRFEVAKSNGEAYISIRGASFINGINNYSNVLELGEDLWWNGAMHATGNITSQGEMHATGNITSHGNVIAPNITAEHIYANQINDSTLQTIINGIVINNYSSSHFNVSAKTICLGSPNTEASGYKVLVSGNLFVDKKLYCSGDVSGATITNRSDRKIKKNIRKTETKNALSSINSLSIYDYDLKNVAKSVKMGLMADEAPKEIVSDDGEGINLYSYCGLLAMALKELSAKIDVLERNRRENGN